jgi:XrtJ-associated TM-motif-TM protein
MKGKRILLAVGLMLTLATVLPLRAQDGCDDSPEDPTVLLALAGGAGTLAAGIWRARKRTPRNNGATVRKQP